MRCLVAEEEGRAAVHVRSQRRRAEADDQRRRLLGGVGRLALSVLVASLIGTGPVSAAALDEELGRNEVRVYSQSFEIEVGDSIGESQLPERLGQLGYRRVHRRPVEAGEYFWGYENFWIYQRRFSGSKVDVTARLLQLELKRGSGRIKAVREHVQAGAPKSVSALRLAPVLMAESLTEERAPRRPIDLDDVPDYVWQAVLAIEDARFFSHGGVDPRGVARAMLKNALAGKVTQGGSTITQQLVKMRDLSPRRTLGRKVSEAVRALALEADYDKREILIAYLDAVYLGHVHGVAVHGIGAAAEAYFSTSAEALDLGQAALLAGMIQGPNRLHPQRHPERALARQRAVLERLLKLGWAASRDVELARRKGLPRLKISPPHPRVGRQLLSWLRESVEREAPRRSAEDKGVVVYTTLDPLLQSVAERAVEGGLASLRSRRASLRRLSLSAALVAVDGRSGSVLAYVAGDPAAHGDAFDRVRKARRQPGSVVKPLVLLEALESCGEMPPLTASRRVLDAPLEVAVPAGSWSPRNTDGTFRGAVTVREAMVRSLNVPFVRLARYCGFAATARRLGLAGLPVTANAPPAFVLGAIETTPLEVAAAYTVFTSPGDRLTPRLVARIEAPSGRRLHVARKERHKVVSSATAYLVRDLLSEVVERGTATTARLGGFETIGKTGTSSDTRDAWFVGAAGSVVTAVWVGIDSGESLGAGGATVAAPIWRDFMSTAAPTRPGLRLQRPARVVERWIDRHSGLVVREPRHGAERFLFHRNNVPPRQRPWRREGPRTIE
ncbi:MAG: transglycosylase domain-containing protein [Acidobacteriota bacterium]|nr:transglycosylase domain-containing protein [Acidobacteriota bacterium]